MRTGGAEEDLLRRLAEMPFLNRRELAAICRRPRSAVYRAMNRLTNRGMAQAIPHAAPLIPPAARYCLTAAGLERLAALESVTVGRITARRPVSARWRRILLERLDGVAVIYGLTAALGGLGQFAGLVWYRSGPMDASASLSDGRLLAVMRLGNAAERTAFAKRLWRVSQDERPSGVLILAPDEARLRQVRRSLDPLPLRAFLALERDVAQSDDDSRPIWRATGSPDPLYLREILAAIPSSDSQRKAETGPLPRETLPPDLRLDLSDDSVPGHLLPVTLKPSEKRAIDLIHDWPWVSPGHLAQMLAVNRSRLHQIIQRLRNLGVADMVRAGSGSSLVLTDRGMAYLARRDRASVGAALRRWSAASFGNGCESSDWREVRGSRSRQLLRNLEHTRSVHGFLAEMVRQSPQTGCHLAQFDPPRRAVRFFRRSGRLHSIRPDAYGVVERNGREFPFFLEWERRAVRPVTMTARLAPYLRYYSTSRPLDDHGSAPKVLVIFDDEIAAGHFLRVAAREMRRTGVKLPLWVSNKAKLEECGPLGAAWRRPGSYDLRPAFGLATRSRK